MSIPTTYRPEIDGLRTVAVTAVVLFHAFPEYIPGGFVGVDVFFVISGFLITSIIFFEIDAGHFSLRDFYARRVRRLFPALATMLVAATACAWLILLPADLVRFGEQLVASSAFVANLYFWMHANYFGPNANSFALLHLWSLGVEEQFYIFWPLCAMFLPARWRLAAITAVVIVSFALSVATATHYGVNFYSPFTRAWELMAGALLAQIRRPISPLNGDAAVGAGLAAIGLSVFLFDHTQAYPSWRAAVPVAGAALIIVGGGSSSIARLALANKAAVFTGKISYPLYLWHWPILAFATAANLLPLTLPERALCVALAYALSVLTYFAIELPAQAAFRRRPVRLAVAGSLVSMALVGVVAISGSGFPARFPDYVLTSLGEIATSDLRLGRCLLPPQKKSAFAAECVEQQRPLILVWGDSTAASLVPGLKAAQKTVPFGLAQLTANSCLPLLSGAISEECLANNRRVLSEAIRLRPDVVILHGFGSIKDNEDGWRDTVTALGNNGLHTVVIGPVPQWERSINDQIGSYYLAHRSLLPDRSKSLVSPKADDQAAKQFFAGLGAEYVSAWNVLCNADGCLTRLNGVAVAPDGVHLSKYGSAFLADAILSAVLP